MKYEMRSMNYCKGAVVCCLLSALYCLTLTSCKDKLDNFTPNYLYDYAPIESGHYVIYDVDSISYHYANPVYKRDTAHYQLKELIGDTTYDNLNDLTYHLDLYRRPDSNSSWTFDKRWLVKRTTTNFQKTEDDIKFVKLVFAPRFGDTWNGNEYIPTTEPYKLFQNWDYKYDQVNSPYTLGNMTFDSTLTVNEVDNENLIEKTLRKEVYANHIGMIYQEWENMTKTKVVLNWDTAAETGFRIRMRMNSHN